MPAIFEYHHAVTDDEIDDVLRHVNNLAYLKWMQIGGNGPLGGTGLAHRGVSELGAGWVVRSHQIEYLSPALPGDEIVVRTWVADLGKATSMRAVQNRAQQKRRKPFWPSLRPTGHSFNSRITCREESQPRLPALSRSCRIRPRNASSESGIFEDIATCRWRSYEKQIDFT